MNRDCARFVANEYERGRDLERIEELEAENKKARELLQEIYSTWEDPPCNMDPIKIDAMFAEIGKFLDQ